MLSIPGVYLESYSYLYLDYTKSSTVIYIWSIPGVLLLFIPGVYQESYCYLYLEYTWSPTLIHTWSIPEVNLGFYCKPYLELFLNLRILLCIVATEPVKVLVPEQNYEV